MKIACLCNMLALYAVLACFTVDSVLLDHMALKADTSFVSTGIPVEPSQGANPSHHEAPLSAHNAGLPSTKSSIPERKTSGASAGAQRFRTDQTGCSELVFNTSAAGRDAGGKAMFTSSLTTAIRSVVIRA